ncbi:MAG TPA: DUF5009 domain-containing protein [Saprospiraceae bacterium]|nr:DUF5009 domain-containing protein [Saprospiraceae bacterium]HNT22442.1 DUF5009 domain-containing protein [Saprospiraceae bacterium]
MQPFGQVPDQRIHALDVFRGMTIFLMVFVNEVAGIKNLPGQFYHLPAEADGMTMVDWVFAGFLFIVGMSIPFSINQRIRKGDTLFQLFSHILIRTLGLLILGVFMVNASTGHHEASMALPIALWSLLIYPAAILIWNQYRGVPATRAWILRSLGILLLIALALLYRGGQDGSKGLSPQWWGILGLIGWAYLFSSLLYLLSRGRLLVLIAGLAFCTLIYTVGHTELSNQLAFLSWTRDSGGHATHTCIALCGMVLSLILFDTGNKWLGSRRVYPALGWAVLLLIAGMLLRPYFHIGKIPATPSWGFYSSFFSVLAFLLIKWISDLKKSTSWASFFEPAGSNPLLTYIIPFILWAFYRLFDFYPLPDEYRTGLTGVLFCILYSSAILWLVRILNRMNIRLQL